MKFTITGEPIGYYVTKSNSPRGMSQFQFAKIRYVNELQRQYDGEPRISGPVRLDIQFYFKKPLRRKFVPNHPIDGAHIYNLVHFLETALISTVLAPDCLPVEINAVKLYDIDPRVEFTLIELR